MVTGHTCIVLSICKNNTHAIDMKINKSLKRNILASQKRLWRVLKMLKIVWEHLQVNLLHFELWYGDKPIGGQGENYGGLNEECPSYSCVLKHLVYSFVVVFWVGAIYRELWPCWKKYTRVQTSLLFLLGLENVITQICTLYPMSATCFHDACNNEFLSSMKPFLTEVTVA